ncbi:Putative transposase [Mycobacteroides abscessus subsp. massiliense]|uniref:hypothetical protein n=1 Tax=Mycobacteroides abscessus TaxID=36809 RepID=UPI0009A8D60B|nr:hypothetical protein [Mycobacteroides abscessus]SKE39733.1 Putative transposase [Mycobacteroides abscessus subsp. massiliense]SKE47887.1 Putative transposase [Mycobacteroides abscessus subsp. massiliense]SKG07775.1 Putative transposase [Mycobacteroides abscessus subsp. massiliense]SKG25376.1 Putative transposase [Mycobacteroides abscessus subsp. massiliense]SKG50737.1 Putative transposase [Mycobacteroides abscessus subsp. massiliense]
MDSDPEFEALVDEAVSSWGKEFGFYGYTELEYAIMGLYRSRLEFPPTWTVDQCNEFIESRASRDADEIGASFDDLADTVAESLRWHCHLHGYGLHSEDISAHVDLARRSKIDDLRWCMVDEIPDEIRRVDRELAEELAHQM